MKALVLALVLLAAPAFAWDGYDWKNGSFVDVEKGNRVRPGRDIEYFDYGAGRYRTGEVESVDRRGNLEVRDGETGELREFDMD